MHKIKILVTAGGTSEPIDDVRRITNVSTGALGSMIADVFAKKYGAEVTFLHGENSLKPSDKKIKTVEVSTAADAAEKLASLLKTKRFDAIVHAMAVSDYSPVRQKGKIPSDKKTLVLTLKRTPKIINIIKKIAPDAVLAGFKLLSGSSEKQLLAACGKLLKTSGCDFVFANDLSDIKDGKHKGFLIDKKFKILRAGTKKGAAALIAKNVAGRIL